MVKKEMIDERIEGKRIEKCLKLHNSKKNMLCHVPMRWRGTSEMRSKASEIEGMENETREAIGKMEDTTRESGKEGGRGNSQKGETKENPRTMRKEGRGGGLPEDHYLRSSVDGNETGNMRKNWWGAQRVCGGSEESV